MAPSYTDNNYGCKWKPRKVCAKRDFPAAFYEPCNESSGNQLSKKQKVCESSKSSYKDHVGLDESGSSASADKHMFDFIPLETETETGSSESCGSGTPGSGYDIIPRNVYAKTRCSDEGIEKLGPKTRSADEGFEKLGLKICSSDEEIEKLGPYTELRLHGVCVKEIKWYQTEDGLKIELSVDKLQKPIIDEESVGKTCESVTDRVWNERVKRYEQMSPCRRPVSAVRSHPPGCGPVLKTYR